MPATELPGIMETTRPATKDELAQWGNGWDLHQWTLRVELGDAEYPEIWMIEKRADGESVG